MRGWGRPPGNTYTIRFFIKNKKTYGVRGKETLLKLYKLGHKHALKHISFRVTEA